MSVINRAILYLTRKKSRAVILLLAFFVLSIFSMIFLSVSSAVSQELKSLETNLASSFTFTVNYDHFQAAQAVNEHTDFSTISDANLVTLQSLDGVAHCYTHFTPSWLIWADLDTGDEWFIKELNAEENLTPKAGDERHKVRLCRRHTYTLPVCNKQQSKGHTKSAYITSGQRRCHYHH